MKLGIDASNIRAGGGVTHLREMLAAADPLAHGIEAVHVWSNQGTLTALPTRPWLRLVHEPALDGGLARRTAWRYLALQRRLRHSEIDVLLVPGGVFTGRFRPIVAISQNLLPFEEGERQRFGRSRMRLRIELVRRAQIKTFRAANGLIFNTKTAQGIVERQLGSDHTGAVATIPFGVDERFSLAPRKQEPIDEYSFDRPFRLLYVSTVNLYKHQWNVVAAVATLREEGIPVGLDLVGGAYPPAQRRLTEAIDTWDPHRDFVRFLGAIQPRDIIETYRTADATVFASSCETPSFVVLESMASGLPIACADRSAMPEILGEAAEYFDPEDPASITRALREMLAFTQRRTDLARGAFERAQEFTWGRCADDTLRFIAEVARNRSAQP